MSSLRTVEKAPFEQLLGMASGYVLDFTNRAFRDFMAETAGVDIYASKYAVQGESKANRLRVFWDVEPDTSVGPVLAALLEYWNYIHPDPNPAEKELLSRCEQVMKRLGGKQVSSRDAERQFLDKDFRAPALPSTVVDATLIPILSSRLQEASLCIKAGAPLATIFLCGSILEGLLVAVACANPKEFNQASASPKGSTGKVQPFHLWKLSQLIDVAFELGYLTLDVKKFSHVLRDFRNYIHPYQQASSKFNPDKHTAEICFQVLKAAVACLEGSRD